MNKEALCENLLQWLNTFSIPCPHSTIEEVSDGVALATVLSQIAPDWFDDKWLAKIKQNAGNNWRMKVSNLKKILQGILDYYNEVLGQNIQNFSMPDVHKIGESGDATELARFLQLILGCAVNCDKKQNYIEAIMGMEEVVQQAIMAAIQELMTKESFMSTVDSLSSFDPQIRRLTDEMEILRQMKESYMQKCHELDLQVSLLNEEKAAVSTENEKLLQRVKDFETSVDTPNKINYLRQQVETLREEIDKLENAKEESKLKFEKLEKDNLDLVARLEVFQNAAEAARQQQDELDILRESQAKFQAQESSIAQYKKKLEELGNMKRQFKTLEEKNSEYMQRNLELEEELMRTGSWKPQLEIYKKQVSELRQKLIEETKRADKSEFEMNKMAEKLLAIQREKERLLTERDNLKENYEELRCCTLQSTPVTQSNHLASETLGIIPIDMTEQMEKLKIELKEVREKESSKIGLLQAQIDHLQEREAELTSDNRIASKRIVELESQIDEQTCHMMPVEAGSKTIVKLDKELQEIKVALKDKEAQVQTLEEALEKKEHDMHAMEERYKKYLDKAKVIVKCLGPADNSSGSPEGPTLISQLLDKERIIEGLERDAASKKSMRDEEERLMASAFHSLGLQLHRNSMERRLNLLTGQSFLSRQRQASSRKISGEYD